MPKPSMIKRLQNNDTKVAEIIRSVFLRSYAIEAKLLKAVDFPPLKRSLASYLDSRNDFIGFCHDQEVKGIIEVDHKLEFTHIQSLVVDPDYFRQGIAQQLMEYTLNAFDSDLFVVETGVDNGPAIALYKKLDFKETDQWETDHGVRKVKFERVIISC